MDKYTPVKVRETEYDLLRALSVIGVIVIHVCAMQWRKLPTSDCDWTVLHVYHILMKFSVPVFFMISGRFMLDPERDYPVRKVLNKTFHLVVVFIFWSAVYTLLNMGRVLQAGGQLAGNKWVFVEFFYGEYHMWFLFTIAGLYILTPLLRYIAASREMTGYYLALFLVFGTVIPFLEMLPTVGGIIEEMNHKLLMDVAVGYSGYYMMGHWLRTAALSDKREKQLYIGGFLGAIFTVAATWYTSRVSGTADESMAGYLTPNVMLTSAAVYRFGLSRLKDLKLGNWISCLAEASFGCYLIHPLILWIFEWINLMPTLLPPVIMVPMLSGVTLLISVVLTVLIKKVPILRSIVT